MNRTLALVSALSVGFSAAVFTTPAMAQAASAGSAVAPAATAPVKPEAIPAKIAVIDFEGAVAATNEGIKAIQDIQTKYAPSQKKVQDEAAEVDQLRKQVEALPANTPDADRQSRLQTIDGKEKQLNLDLETAQNQFNAELQETMGKIAQKVSPVVTKYLQDNGFTLMLSRGQQQDTVLWWDAKTDISAAIVEAYNASSGVAAPLPAAPATGTAPKAAPRTGPAAPRTAPKPAAPTSK